MKICRIYLVSENMNTKILFEFNIQSITDIITNSSSELFVVKGDRYSSAFEDFLYVENIGDLQRYLEQKEILLPEIRKYLKNPPKTICDRLDIDDYRNALREAIKNNDLDKYKDYSFIVLEDHMDYETWQAIRDSLYPNIYYESWH